MAPDSASRNAARFAPLIIALSLVTPGAGAQTQLNVPHSAEEVRQFVDPPSNAPCTTCGIVVSVSTQAAPAARARARVDLARNPTLTGGPGGPLATVPIAGKSAGSTPETITSITVRYDNGAYGRFEQNGEAQVKKGDRVRVTDDRVEPYPR
jgi:hypothetical protein